MAQKSPDYKQLYQKKQKKRQEGEKKTHKTTLPKFLNACHFYLYLKKKFFLNSIKVTSSAFRLICGLVLFYKSVIILYMMSHCYFSIAAKTPIHCYLGNNV